jgi:small conductance mechanosensitive channel
MPKKIRRCCAGAAIPLLALLLTLSVMPASAQTEESGKPQQTYEQLFDAIDQEKLRIDKLEKRAATAEGLTLAAVETRLIKARINLLEHNLDFVRYVISQEESGTTDPELRQQAVDILNVQIRISKDTASLLRGKIAPPEESLPAAEKAASYSQIFEQVDRINRVYQLYIDSVMLAPELGMDVTEERARLEENLLERAENGSVLLEMAMSEVRALRASVAAVPGDAEAKAQLNVATSNVTSIARGITRVVEMMSSLGMETTEYQNQLLVATGEITTDIFQVDVFTNLFLGWGETLWNQIIDNGPALVFKLVLLIIIIFVFLKIAGVAQRLTERALEDSRFELSMLLKRMVVSIVRNTVLVIGILIALAQVGISLGPLLAGMGLVGFVVGFALQDTLSNFAAGMLILIYRPFDVDDVVEAGGVSGKVSKMSLVNTTIMTFDNQTIIVPNGKIWGDIIKNVTAQTMRRVDLVFGIGYGDDIEKAERVLAEVVAAHPAVLSEPQTMIRLHELGDSSVNFIVRPWVNRDDYWETYWALTRAVKLRFDEEGISIPFPQRDVHLYQE